ncbi:MAG: TIGR02996 domain-containing protein [Planctomycetes bacterium]|nr:TIGR02996 domain-containing protein [Planctomycetota bacterium]
MNEETAFLSAIRQNPADETARLVYADWLDEQGDPASIAKAEFIRLELQMAPAPTQSLNRIRWLNKLQKLAVNLDSQWLAIVSHPKLEACRVSFQFACPNQWEKLTPTGDEKARFCESCKKSVHYCDTLDEAREHTAQGDCVAVTLALIRRPFDTQPPRPQPPRFLAPPRDRGSVALGMIRGMATVSHPTPAAINSPLPVEPTPESEPEPRQIQKRVAKNRRQRNRNIQRENWESE